MNIAKNSEEESYNIKKAIAFGLAQVADVTSIQTFSFLIFTFYFTVVGIDVNLITMGFIIWSFWNAINDPLVGYLSDRTHTKWGRRIPFVMVSLIPLSIIMVLLFTPPIESATIINFTYFLSIIIIWEGIYTIFAVSQTSLFPEVFLEVSDRNKANNIRQMFSIVGLIMAFIIPTIIIPDMTKKEFLINYQIVGIVAGIIILVCGILFLKLGVKEREEFKEDYKAAPSFLDNIRFTIKNKAFRWFIPAEMVTWFIFGMLPAIVPLYGKHVLNIGGGDSYLLGLLMATTFLSAAVFMNLWKGVAQKYGLRKSYLISMTTFIFTLIPLLFINSVALAFVVFILVGLGISGNIYYSDLILCDIIDADEVETKIRREAGYYGVNALFMRLSVILVYLSINLIFNNIGWYIYEPENITPQVILGLKALIAIFPIIALIIGILVMIKYPLDGEKLTEMKNKLQIIHLEKK